MASASSTPAPTPRIHLRPATSLDIPSITSIYNHEIVHTPFLFNYDPVSEEDRLAWLESTRDAGYPVWVAVHREEQHGAGEDAVAKETIIGYCSLGPFKVKAGYRK